MAIKNFNFPGVTLTQEFVASNVGNQTVLSVACIGRPYYLHRADVASEAATVEIDYKAGTASTQALPNMTTEVLLDGTATVAAVDGSSVAIEYQKLFVEDGVFAHVTVTGGTYASGLKSTDKSVTLNVGKNVKSGAGQTAAAEFGTREAEVGDTVALSGTSVSGTAVITAIIKSSDNSGYDTVIATPKAGTITGSSAKVTEIKFLVTQDAELFSDVTGNTSAVAVSLSGGSFTVPETVYGEVGGKFNVLQDCKTDFSVEYRQIANKWKGKLGSVYNADAVDEILGGACMANPLALAVKLACRAAPNTLVYFTTPNAADDTVDSFQEALDFLGKYEEIYSIVPLTGDRAILAALLNDVIATSEDEESKIRRTLWYGLDGILDETETGNWDRVNKIIAARKELQSSYKAQAVWADGAKYNDEKIPNYILAAAPAGMRSYQPCHRPLSNLPYDFITVSEPHGFTKGQLKAIGAEGIWIIGNNTDDVPINMRQVTTAAANDLNQDEESIVANIDEICLSLCHIGEDSVGCSNINDTMILALSDDISILMDSKLINQTGSAYIGAQLISWTLDSIYQDPVHKDRIYAIITCEPPKPFNEFKITLRVI